MSYALYLGLTAAGVALSAIGMPAATAAALAAVAGLAPPRRRSQANC